MNQRGYKIYFIVLYWDLFPLSPKREQINWACSMNVQLKSYQTISHALILFIIKNKIK
jgi:hypothetical protein